MSESIQEHAAQVAHDDYISAVASRALFISDALDTGHSDVLSEGDIIDRAFSTTPCPISLLHAPVAGEREAVIERFRDMTRSNRKARRDGR